MEKYFCIFKQTPQVIFVMHSDDVSLPSWCTAPPQEVESRVCFTFQRVVVHDHKWENDEIETIVSAKHLYAKDNAPNEGVGVTQTNGCGCLSDKPRLTCLGFSFLPPWSFCQDDTSRASVQGLYKGTETPSVIKSERVEASGSSQRGEDILLCGKKKIIKQNKLCLFHGC